LREQVGGVFILKTVILAGVVGLATVTFRPYCRALCPLGAIYGWFNRVSLIGLNHSPHLCTDCGECSRGCNSGLDPRTETVNSECLRCLSCATKYCPRGAMQVRVGGRQGESPRGAGTPDECPS
jgi:polyferredoxin